MVLGVGGWREGREVIKVKEVLEVWGCLLVNGSGIREERGESFKGVSEW